MEKIFVFCLLLLVALDFSSADSKVNDNLDPNLNGTSIVNAKASKGSNLDDSNEQVGDQVSGSKDGAADKGSSSDQFGSKNTQSRETEKGKSDDRAKVSESRGNQGCDSSDKCSDEENKFVACLRVPGYDSEDGSVLSLLIQNNGKSPLNIDISAPNFVTLETTKVVLEGKRYRKVKVKVSVTKGGNDSLITLKAGNNGHCSLDFTNMFMHTGDHHHDSRMFADIISQKSTIAFLCLALLLILVSGWMCMSFRRKKAASNYMELPVSVIELDTNDGWDNGWGDDWEEDEEAPSIPVTPSLSSKGLDESFWTRRKFNKDGWKD